ncbi:MAG TPA: hypothetical protein VN381_05560 [Anaerovoracaceae bacterium]|nr:hypothetical protein [Anaerovoracaceae bacterium]
MMKKILVIGLFFLLILSGCSETQPDTPTDDPLLSGLLEAVETVDLNYARIDADHSTYSDLKSVRVTKDLLNEISDALLAGNPERLEPPLRSVSSSGKSQTIMLQFPFEDNQHVIIELFDNTDEKPDQAVMWMQLDEDMAQYTLERSAFEKIYELVAAQTFPKELLLGGDYVRYLPTGVAAGELSSGPQDVLEVGGKLLFLWGEGDDYRLEAVNPQAGEAERVWEYTAPQEAGRMPLALESADYDGFDYRITGHGTVIYRNSGDPIASQIFEAPREILQSNRFSYDVHPQTGRIAYSADDGVYVGTENNMTRILDHKDAPQPPNQGDSPLPDEFSAYYGEVRLLNGGRHLAAVVISPGSQSGRQALALTEIETGNVTLFDNLFSAMIADVSYPDDQTIAASSMEWVTIIDVTSGQRSRLLFDESGATNDFTTWVDLRQDKGGDGVPTGFVTAYRTETPDQAKQLLKVTGENAWIVKVTQNYTILFCSDSQETFVAIIPL